MKFKIFGFENHLQFDEDNPGLVVFKNELLLSKMIYELKKVVRTKIEIDEYLILDDEGNVTNLHKTLNIIVDPFEIDLNTREIKNILYSKIEAEINEDYVMKNSFIASIEKVTQTIVPIIREFSLDLDYYTPETIQHYLKYIDLHIVQDTFNTPMGNLYNYLDVVSELMRHQVIMFINLSTFLPEQEYKDLINHLKSSKIKTILIESRELTDSFSSQWIIDQNFDDYIKK